MSFARDRDVLHNLIVVLSRDIPRDLVVVQLLLSLAFARDPHNLI